MDESIGRLSLDREGPDVAGEISHSQFGTGLTGTWLNGYLVLQGNVGFRTA